MKRLLLPLIAALALPTAVSANAFWDLEVQPKDASEWFHLGFTHSYGASLCTLWVAGDITFERAKFYRDGLVRRYRKEAGERGERFAIGGFNQGIVSMQNLDKRTEIEDFGLRFSKCEKLKIK